MTGTDSILLTQAGIQVRSGLAALGILEEERTA